MKIIFMGTPPFSVPILQMVHEKYGVDLLVTQPDKLVGRKKVLTYPPTKEYALKEAIPILQPVKLKPAAMEILSYEPDLIITAAYGKILPKPLLDTPRLGAINVHASLLPELRGGAPIQRAIERGHDTTGVTIMYMSEGMDEGDILATRSLAIAPDETAGSLFEKLSLLGRDLLEEILPELIVGRLEAIPQDHSKATYAPNIKREEEYLDFSQPAEILERKIRAFHPEPNTYTLVDGVPLKIIRAKRLPLDDSAPPGTVVAHAKEGPVVSTSRGSLCLTRVQLAGKKETDGTSFLNGKGKVLLAVGKQLGERA